MDDDTARIRRFVNRFRDRFDITEAVFFGSRARGDNLVHSDFDLILVSPDFDGMRMAERAAAVLDYWNHNRQLEVFCYTPEEFQRKKEQIGTVRTAVEEGVPVG